MWETMVTETTISLKKKKKVKLYFEEDGPVNK